VIHKNVIHGSGSWSRSVEPKSSASMTAVAMTVLPEPVMAESANEERSLDSAQSRRVWRSRLRISAAASRW